MTTIPQTIEQTIEKTEAIDRFRNVAKCVYTNHGRRRTEAAYEDIVAFHVVFNRLNDLAIEYPDKKVMAIDLHPFYPVIELRKEHRFFWSHGLFHRFVGWYLPLLERVPELRQVAQAYKNDVTYAEQVKDAYAAIEREFGLAQLEASKPDVIQEHYAVLQGKQLELFA